MTEYDVDDLARDQRENRTIALLASALASSGSTRTPQAGVVIGRAEVYQAWLNEGLPKVTVLPYEQCSRQTPHRGHKHYGELDERVRCAGVE